MSRLSVSIGGQGTRKTVDTRDSCREGKDLNSLKSLTGVTRNVCLLVGVIHSPSKEETGLI